MGYSQAVGMAEAVQDGRIDLDAALQYHLQHNHYPPLAECMVAVAREAIEACARNRSDKGIRLPDGVTLRDMPVPAAWRVVEALHLEPFVDALREEA